MRLPRPPRILPRKVEARRKQNHSRHGPANRENEPRDVVAGLVLLLPVLGPCGVADGVADHDDRVCRQACQTVHGRRSALRTQYQWSDGDKEARRARRRADVNVRFVWPAVVEPTHASMTTKGAMDVTVRQFYLAFAAGVSSQGDSPEIQ